MDLREEDAAGRHRDRLCRRGDRQKLWRQARVLGRRDPDIET